MKFVLPIPGGRSAGWTVLVALLLTSHPVLADLSRGAARQRQSIKARPAVAVAAPAKSPASCGACCPANQPAEETLYVTTGTQIPKASRRKGLTTDGAQNVQVLDRRQLERTGAASVTDAVRRLVP